MDREIELSKKVYNRTKYEKAVDSRFIELVEEEEIDRDTPEEFFRLYEKLFYEIPKEGEVNSHTYLIKESSKLVNLQQESEDIQPLLDEIAQLRRTLLEKDMEILELQNRQAERR